MRKVATEVIGICLLATLPAIASSLFHPQRLSWDANTLKEGEVTVATATQWQQVLWVDARAQRDYKEQHIPDAVLLNEDDWESLLPGLLERWQPGLNVVVYCSSSGCRASSSVADRLRQEVGLESVYVLKDGWEVWLKTAQ